jgi:hypothetical protein
MSIAIWLLPQETLYHEQRQAGGEESRLCLDGDIVMRIGSDGVVRDSRLGRGIRAWASPGADGDEGKEMPTEIRFAQLQELLADGDVELVEVLPAREYEEEHIPGAISIPLKSLGATSVSILDRHKPIVVYCWDDA